MTELYYGLPQSTWDSLCRWAEDSLYDDKIGQHILGLYPAGRRIFGEESSPPGLMCLYMDSVEPLIDPFSNYAQKQLLTIKYGNKKENCSSILYVDFFKWVTWMWEISSWNQEVDLQKAFFLHGIPFGRHVVHEDSSVSPIIELIFKMSIGGTYCPRPMKLGKRNVFGVVNSIQFNRTEATLAHHKTFKPCINEKWDEKLTLEIENEKEITSEKLEETYKEMILLNQPYTKPNKKLVEEIRKMVMDLYRFQL